MTGIQEKADSILAYEKEFADHLARQVIAAPKPTVWMILVPFLLIFHVFNMKRSQSGRKVFSQNYVISRERALKEAVKRIQNGSRTDIAGLVGKAENLPPSAVEEYTAFLTLLADHYADLLSAEGGSFDALIRCAYKNKENFLLFINQLNSVEKKLNAALTPHINESSGNIKEIVSVIEDFAKHLRRHNADIIFA